MTSEALRLLQEKKRILEQSIKLNPIILKRSNLKRKVIDIWDTPDPISEYTRCSSCQRKFKRHEEIRFRLGSTVGSGMEYCRKCANNICNCLDPECEHNNNWQEGLPTFVNACAIKSILTHRPILRTPVMFKRSEGGGRKVTIVYGIEIEPDTPGALGLHDGNALGHAPNYHMNSYGSSLSKDRPLKMVLGTIVAEALGSNHTE